MGNARERIVETASQLIETQGYHATGLNQIIQESGAPKGSLYYYFPGGKQELAAEAIQHTGRQVEERIWTALEAIDDPAEAVRQFALTLSTHVAASQYRTGGPIAAVALESATTSEQVNAACQEVYTQWQSAFAAKLAGSGIGLGRAVQLATLAVAALEGAVVLSRTAHNVEPLRSVAEELALLIRAACE